jgi:hypothetical protein
VARAAQNRPPLVAELEKKYGRDLGSNGCLYVGDKGYMTTDAYGDGVRIVPEEKHTRLSAAAEKPPAHQRHPPAQLLRGVPRGRPGLRGLRVFRAADGNRAARLPGGARRRGAPGRVGRPGDACANRPELNAYLASASREGWTC